MLNNWAFSGFRSHLALRTIRVNPIYVLARKPIFFPGNTFNLDLPTTFFAEKNPPAIRLSERLVRPHLANVKSNRPVLTRANVNRLAIPTRVALLAYRQGTFLSKIPRNTPSRFEWLLFTHPRFLIIRELVVPMHSFLPTNGRITPPVMKIECSVCAFGPSARLAWPEYGRFVGRSHEGICDAHLPSPCPTTGCFLCIVRGPSPSALPNCSINPPNFTYSRLTHSWCAPASST